MDETRALCHALPSSKLLVKASAGHLLLRHRRACFSSSRCRSMLSSELHTFHPQDLAFTQICTSGKLASSGTLVESCFVMKRILHITLKITVYAVPSPRVSFAVS